MVTLKPKNKAAADPFDQTTATHPRWKTVS